MPPVPLWSELFRPTFQHDSRHEPNVTAGALHVEKVLPVLGSDAVDVRLAARLVLAPRAGVPAADLRVFSGHATRLSFTRSMQAVIWPALRLTCVTLPP
jgi:hypothetical protein